MDKAKREFMKLISGAFMSAGFSCLLLSRPLNNLLNNPKFIFNRKRRLYNIGLNIYKDWGTIYSYSNINKKPIKLIVSLKPFMRLHNDYNAPIIEAYVFPQGLNINTIERPQWIFIQGDPLKISFAGSNISHEMRSVGVGFYDKVYAVMDNIRISDINNNGRKIIDSISGEYNAYFSKFKGLLPYQELAKSLKNELSLRIRDYKYEFYSTAKKPDNDYELIGRCYLLKSFTAFYSDLIEKKNLFRSDAESLILIWIFFLDSLDLLINENLNIENKTKKILIFHLLGSIEWIGYLYWRYVLPSNFNYMKKVKQNQFIRFVQLINKIIKTDLILIFESIWAVSWIGLVADESSRKLLYRQLEYLGMYQDDSYYNNFIKKNILLARYRMFDAEFRSAMALLLCSNKSGKIIQYKEHPLYLSPDKNFSFEDMDNEDKMLIVENRTKQFAKEYY